MAYTDTPFVKILTGVRRCGKSTILKMIMERLKTQRGIPEERIERLKYEKQERARKADALNGFMREITQLPEMNIAFSDVRFSKTVDHITIYNDGRLVFSFFVGKDITVEI